MLHPRIVVLNFLPKNFWLSGQRSQRYKSRLQKNKLNQSNKCKILILPSLKLQHRNKNTYVLALNSYSSHVPLRNMQICEKSASIQPKNTQICVPFAETSSVPRGHVPQGGGRRGRVPHVPGTGGLQGGRFPKT
jgi:hypothetical protein